MKVGFYAGSFDPFTIGHLEVLRKACLLFDKVIVGIGKNPDKQRRFNNEKMKDAIEKVLKRENLKNASVVIYEGLTVDTAKENDASFLIRGIRSVADYYYEEPLARINEKLSGLDTIYLRAGELGKVSSSIVYKLHKKKKDVSVLVPEEVLEVMNEK